MPRLQLAEWRVEQLRLSAFPVVGSDASPSAWWEDAVGVAPEQTETNSKAGTASVSGAFGVGMLSLQREPARLDWRLTAADLPPDLELLSLQPELPTAGSYEESRDGFVGVCERWLSGKDLPDITRLAFGAVLIHREPDRRAGYVRLPDYVPVTVDPDSSDFLYQINQPRPSVVLENLPINRLSKWSVGAFKRLGLRLTAGAAPQPVVSPTATFMLRLELDINTAAEHQRPLPSAQLVDLFRELVRHGEGIVTEGVGAR